VGTAVGALLLLSAGMRTVVVADILTFIASLAMLARFLPRAPDLAPAPLRPRGGRTRRRLATGVRPVIAAIFLLNLGAGLINLYPNVVSREFAGAGDPGLSSFYLFNGCGGLLGALVAVRLGTRVSATRLMQAATGLVAIALLGMTQLDSAFLPLVMSSAMLFFGQL